MATITNAQVTTILADYAYWFGPHDTVTGVTDDVTDDATDFTFETADNVEVSINYTELTNPVTAKQIIIAAVVDGLAAAVSADDYGPLVRASAVGDLPYTLLDSPRILFATSSGKQAALRYRDLLNAETRNRIVYAVEGIAHRFLDLRSEIATLNTATQARVYNDYTDWKETISGLQSLVRKYIGQ